MGTPNSADYNPLELDVHSLSQSCFDEERELGKKIVEQVNQLVARLKPILKYITKPKGAHHLTQVCTLERGGGFVLVLTSEAQWGRANDSETDEIYFDNESWRYFPIGAILSGLAETLKRAEDERRARLESISVASKKITQIAEILK